MVLCSPAFCTAAPGEERMPLLPGCLGRHIPKRSQYLLKPPPLEKKKDGSTGKSVKMLTIKYKPAYEVLDCCREEFFPFYVCFKR